jgi:hypothetical protein
VKKPPLDIGIITGPKLRAAEPVPGQTEQKATEVMGGVTVFWLAKAFGLEVSTVRKKLADCPVMGRKTSGFVYSLPQAAAYLVRPRLDIAAYMEQLKPGELPVQLQPTYWEGVLKRQKFESMAKQLWLAEDVMEIFSEVFKTIKFTLQLWPDTLEREGNFSDEQRASLTVMVDQLAEEIHRSIVEMSAKRTTPSSLERFQEQVAAIRDQGPVYMDLNDEDDEDEDIL